MKLRIQKYLSEQGICSRREAEDLIRKGLISVNGQIVTEMGIQIDPEADKVELLEKGKETMTEKITVALNKPRGLVCSRDSSEGETIFDAYPQFLSLNIVGRLDKDSEGLILISNDGAVTKAVTGDKHVTEKEYEVTVRENIPTNMKMLFEAGIELEDGPTLPARVKLANQHIFIIIIREGRKHQIRRMCEFMHLTVTKLKRIRIGQILISGLGVGEYRMLTQQEVATFKESLKNK